MAEPRCSPKRVLVVDDEPDVRAATSLLINALYDCEVVQAKNGRLGLETLAAQQFDLVITDYLMPEMDGMAFAAEVRARQASLPILMITAFPGDVNKPGNPADAILPKPFRVPDLKAAIERAMSRPVAN